MVCQRCKKQTATVHLTDLVKGEKREKHLCEQCAAHEGVTVKQHISINDVLNSFLMSQTGVQQLAQLKCPDCGMSFVEFRSQGLLGCPRDYDVFGEVLNGMIERAQDGHTQHAGKAPGQSKVVDPRQQKRLRLHRELREAIENEKYELAAQLRDQLAELDAQ
ncbi:MAG TPA: UvrB/UvrC motif-containing protein [Phycisphaerae bacterium]|nr:UvrB/UvrC motif-containing protein [Phycisphaerae bacterium]HRY67262.1 UvrB/UvrC motif-containing protein [Phycisphaerae bacterium]HSA26368.1 UvrB/UvrC motif-containing protein [Phycisphaerae bacterium]